MVLYFDQGELTVYHRDGKKETYTPSINSHFTSLNNYSNMFSCSSEFGNKKHVTHIHRYVSLPGVFVIAQRFHRILYSLRIINHTMI